VTDARAYPYWKLSGFYFAYFAVLGAMVPFWSLFLQDRGFSLTEIALLTAIPLGTRIVAPNIWGWIADHRNARLPVVRAGTLVAIVLFCGVWFVDSFAGMALVMTGYSFFWNAVLPQFEVVTLNHLGPRIAEYSRVRLWGSIGFIIAVVGLGAVFDIISVAWLPAFMLAIMVAMWWMSLVTAEVVAAARQHTDAGEFMRLLRQPVIWALLVACLLINLSHGPYYTYFSIYLETRGWTRLGIGGLWALGVIAEVIVFIYMHRILAGVGAVAVLGAAAFGVVVRWLLLAYFLRQPRGVAVRTGAARSDFRVSARGGHTPDAFAVHRKQPGPRSGAFFQHELRRRRCLGCAGGRCIVACLRRTGFLRGDVSDGRACASHHADARASPAVACNPDNPA
jgi:PPP family 3-phenylpropionic acid transporter